MACADKAHKVDGDGGARACSLTSHAAGSSTLVALRPPTGVRGPSTQTSFLAVDKTLITVTAHWQFYWVKRANYTVYTPTS